MSDLITSVDGLDLTCLAAKTVAAEVRRRIELRLADWGLPYLSHDAQLIAAELIANAVTATPDEQIQIRFTREPDGVLISVWDGSNRLPQVQRSRELALKDLDLAPENFDDNGGWGLRIVQATATECGVRQTEPYGKWVWARLSASR